ncbi:MAG: gliding motility protein GldL [Bacteroidales bacterium]|nr:gliding motility protein GldL [Bacteroidales bacterium]
MNAIERLVRTNGYKNFMAKLYGWGAAVVILGALFKILHWPGANIMLMVGMFTETIIFFFSAFEPLHVEYNWALVYPELAIAEEPAEPSKREKKKLAQNGTPTQQLDKMLEEAKIGPELIESLATGMRNLSDNAKKLAGVSDAAVATDSFVGNMTKAAESVRNLTLKYDKAAAAIDTDGSASAAYVESLKKATTAVNQLTAAYEQTTTYKTEMDKLTNNIAALSKVYGNMLAAMGVNPNK